VLIDNVVVRVDESSLTGEAEEQRKSSDSDPFLLSSCTVQEVEGCAEARMIVFGVGHSSQWGRIRAALVSGGDEEKTTPLQDKLEDLAKKIGFVGLAFAVLIFVVLIANSFVGPHATDKPEASQVVDAFVVAITVVVVAIPGTRKPEH
jgi:magnesium-transporting ATPase (P-type)